MKTRHKLIAAIKILIVIYPSITFFLYFFSGFISGFPLYVRTLIIAISLVPWMVFIGLPLLDLFIGLFSRGSEKV